MIRHGLELVAGAAIAALLTLAAMIYAGHVLGPAAYADFATALGVVYVVTVALWPVVPTVARITTTHANRNDMPAIASLRSTLMRSSAWPLAIAIGLTLIVLLPAARWLRLRSSATLAFAVIAALAYVLVSVERGFLQGLFRFRQYNLNVIVESALRAILIAMFLQRFATAAFATFAWSVGSLCACALAIVAVSRLLGGAAPRSVAHTDFAAMLRPMIVLMISFAMLQNADVFAVKRWLTAEQAGAYGAAGALARGLGVLFGPLYALAGPLLTRAHHGSEDVFRATLRLTGAYVALVAVPLILLSIWAQTILVALYGRPYAIGSTVLLPLCGVTAIAYVALMLSQAFITVGDYRFVAIFVAAAIAQIGGLAFAHGSYQQILATLYAAQGTALLLIAALFWRLALRHRGAQSPARVS